MQTLETTLADHPFFRGLPPDDLRLIAGCGSNVRFNAGEYISREGDPSDRFYLTVTGRSRSRFPRRSEAA